MRARRQTCYTVRYMFTNLDLTGIAIFIIMLLISVSFHEMMHAFVAYKLGDDLAHSHGRISLNPLRHIDPILTLALPAVMLLLGQPPILAARPVPINTNRISGDELGLAAVGVAGPITNLALATVAAVVFNAVMPSYGIVYDLFEMFIKLNVGLFVFNMMPIPPLDGSRLLYALAPPSVQRFMEQIEAIGIAFILIFLIAFSSAIGPVLDNANKFILNVLIR